MIDQLTKLSKKMKKYTAHQAKINHRFINIGVDVNAKKDETNKIEDEGFETVKEMGNDGMKEVMKQSRRGEGRSSNYEGDG